MFLSRPRPRGRPPADQMFLDLIGVFKKIGKMADWQPSVWEILAPPLSLIDLHVTDYWVITLLLKIEVKDVADVSVCCSLYSPLRNYFSPVCTLQVLFERVPGGKEHSYMRIGALLTVSCEKVKTNPKKELIVDRSHGNENTHWNRNNLSNF